MRKTKLIQIMTAVLLICCMVFASGCAEKPEDPAQTHTAQTKPAGAGKETVPADTGANTESPETGDAELVSLRQAMTGTSQLFAVAYFGYHDVMDSDLPVDPFEVMQKCAPQLCMDLPFLLEIPQERVIGTGGELYCVIPLDPDAQVSVSLGAWDDVNEGYIYEESLYFAESGEPILVFCNNAGWSPDVQVTVSGESGDACWYPMVNSNGFVEPLANDNWELLFMDISPYAQMLHTRYSNMVMEGWIVPSADVLVGNSWDGNWDPRWYSCQISFREDSCEIRWNDGIDEEDHIYSDAKWNLSYSDGFGVLTIDMGEFAGELRYNVLYDAEIEWLYLGLDVTDGEIIPGWEPLYTYVGRMAEETLGMEGSWRLAWTEVEGYRDTDAAGSRHIEITLDDEGVYRLSYINDEFSDWSFYDKELIVTDGEMYPGCGNDQWIAEVNYIGNYGTEYYVTLLDDGTLLVQQYFTVDGAPAVGYECFERTN